MLNGLNPSPQISRKFNSQLEDPVQGNDMCHNDFGPNAAERHVDFKRFLTLVDPRTPSPTRKLDPNYKINPLTKQLIHMSKKVMIMGKWISVDEKIFHLKSGMLINYELTTINKVMASNATQYVLMDKRLVLTFEILYHHNNFLIKIYVNYIQG